MKSINGNVLVGAPRSVVRYRYTTEICAECILKTPDQTQILFLSGFEPLGQCYTCEAQNVSIRKVACSDMLNTVACEFCKKSLPQNKSFVRDRHLFCSEQCAGKFFESENEKPVVCDIGACGCGACASCGER